MTLLARRLRGNDLHWIGMCSDGSEHLVERVYDLDCNCWRDGQAVVDEDLWMIPGLRGIVSAPRHETDRAECQSDSAAVEHRTNEFVGECFAEIRIIDDTELLFLFSHG